MTDDKELWARVQEATAALNSAICSAHEAGLRVEANTDLDLREFGKRYPRPIVRVTVSRTLT